MNESLERIISAPSLVRRQWLSTKLAVREVLAYEKRYGSKHLKLACHLALPLILSPEIANLIRINFLGEEQIPWVAEVDFLLSSLCHPTDKELFEVEPSIREVLLVELENQFGWERLYNLAKFMQVYLAHNSELELSSEIIRTQKWIAQAYIDPDKVIEELTNLLNSSLSQENYPSNITKQIQFVTTLELLAEPLKRTNKTKEYRYLVNNSRVLSQILYGEEEQLKQKSNLNRKQTEKKNKLNEYLVKVSPNIVELMLNVVQKPTVNLSNWLQNLIEEGWQTVEEILGSRTEILLPATRYLGRDFDKSIARATKIDFGKHQTSTSLALIVEISTKKSEDLSVSLRIFSLEHQSFLPLGLKFAVLDATGKVVRMLENQNKDRWIRFDINCVPGEEFSVIITLDDENITIDFVV